MALNTKSYKYKEFYDVLNNRKGFSSKQFTKPNEEERFCRIKVGNIYIPLFSDPSEQIFEMLYENGTDSLVGKGTNTVLDQKVRKSKEFASDLIQWDDKFISKCKEKISESLKEMNAGKLVNLTPHKVIVYAPEDFFRDHMDSVHTPGQSMTAVVEIPMKYDKEEYLRVEGYSYDPVEGTTLFVFDHDLTHCVYPVENYRISITFDLEIDPELEKLPKIDHIIDEWKSLGVKKVGFFTLHTYFEDQPLKGVDARLFDLLIPHCKSSEKLNLKSFEEEEYIEDEYVTKNNWYHPRVWRLMNNAPDAGRLMTEVYSDEEEEEEWCNKKIDEPIEWERWGGEEDSSSWVVEKCQWSDVIADKYSLGDVFRLWTPVKSKLSMKGREDVHLGNEGFYGEIYESMFVLFELN